MTVNLDPLVYVQVRKVRDMCVVVATGKALNKRCPITLWPGAVAKTLHTGGAMVSSNLLHFPPGQARAERFHASASERGFLHHQGRTSSEPVGGGSRGGSKASPRRGRLRAGEHPAGDSELETHLGTLEEARGVGRATLGGSLCPVVCV